MTKPYRENLQERVLKVFDKGKMTVKRISEKKQESKTIFWLPKRTWL
ncbi:MAG: hypothetical protein PV340_01345 [Wolbachia sp.]|nr:hypothetical protein [Wolbachia sp.]